MLFDQFLYRKQNELSTLTTEDILKCINIIKVRFIVEKPAASFKLAKLPVPDVFEPDDCREEILNVFAAAGLDDPNEYLNRSKLFIPDNPTSLLIFVSKLHYFTEMSRCSDDQQLRQSKLLTKSFRDEMCKRSVNEFHETLEIVLEKNLSENDDTSAK